MRPTYLANRRADVGHLEAAIAASDFETASRIGHSMKGTAASYGFDELEGLALALEAAAEAQDSGRLGEAVTAFARRTDALLAAEA